MNLFLTGDFWSFFTFFGLDLVLDFELFGLYSGVVGLDIGLDGLDMALGPELAGLAFEFPGLHLLLFWDFLS